MKFGRLKNFAKGRHKPAVRGQMNGQVRAGIDHDNLAAAAQYIGVGASPREGAGVVSAQGAKGQGHQDPLLGIAVPPLRC